MKRCPIFIWVLLIAAGLYGGSYVLISLTLIDYYTGAFGKADLVGTWELRHLPEIKKDAMSNYDGVSTIKFREDATFEAINYPVIMMDHSIRIVPLQTGTWEIKDVSTPDSRNKWKVFFFEKPYEALNMDVRECKGVIFLNRYVDIDTQDGFEFYKLKK